jgi:hypothetical protein
VFLVCMCEKGWLLAGWKFGQRIFERGSGPVGSPEVSCNGKSGRYAVRIVGVVGNEFGHSKGSFFIISNI